MPDTTPTELHDRIALAVRGVLPVSSSLTHAVVADAVLAVLPHTGLDPADVLPAPCKGCGEPWHKRHICTTDQQPETAPAGTELRDRYAALFRSAPGEARLGDATPGEIADAVMAVAAAEQAALRAEVEGLDEALRGAIAVSEKDGARLRAEMEQLRTDRAAVLREAADALGQRAVVLRELSSSSFGEEAYAARELTEAADRFREQGAADAYARAITVPPSEAVCDAMRERMVSGTAPRRRVRIPATEAKQPTAPADRAAVLREAAALLSEIGTPIFGERSEHERGLMYGAERLRRMADEAQQPETEATDPVNILGVATGGACGECCVARVRGRTPEHAHCRTVLDQPDTETEAAK
ncbi:hypothetical protein [Streptomyces sp. NPDC048669]|uniref:hypothetical protein n=1 Tax=Streptomyces sp. NPDC048669 TaxID=3155267 RepID=UPI00341A24BA